jgi:hypothetical protein
MQYKARCLERKLRVGGFDLALELPRGNLSDRHRSAHITAQSEELGGQKMIKKGWQEQQETANDHCDEQQCSEDCMDKSLHNKSHRLVERALVR